MIIDTIAELFFSFYKNKPDRIEKLPQSGSDRIYFRIYCGNNTFIATHGNNIQENKTFIAFSKFFKEKKLPVPQIFAVNEDETVYIQEDLGTVSLLNILEEKGHGKEAYMLFQKSLKQLARIQITGNENFDYSLCLTAHEFGRQAIINDLLYFKYYFLDTLKLPYDKQAMLMDMDALAVYLTHTKYKYFMFRDFQSRNIIVENGEVNFIDYQGGMRGALQYDVASLLWQAKADLSEDWKTALLNYYMNEVSSLLQEPVDKSLFTNQYNGYVLIRLLQVLGAYGFRGLFERKAHFLTSIPLALKNLKWFLQNNKTGIDLPELERVLNIMVSEEMVQRFQPIQATSESALVVEINSFSYKKEIPKDKSMNGGGFVFDCRGILNPGRYDEYKTLSGKDKPVQDFLEQKTKMPDFLNSVFDLIDISVENYLQRNFAHLQINFGCTGGQHRSVYAAEQTARHLRNKYKVKTALCHTNEENWRRDE
ncbi:MAG: phosphotransferase [Chitinophagaceae bacterium]|jgi:aminoglycoside/choline kinase family phosphotransferase|nr:phosphotransferase [Chitinophagaceae bacterium]